MRVSDSAGVSLALSELCQDCRYGGGRIPLSAILDLSTLPKFNQVTRIMIGLNNVFSETAPKCVRSAGTARGERPA